MNVLYWLLVGLGSTTTGRLRDLFDSVKEFAKESGSAPSEEATSRIIESAVRFANNNGNDLDNFLNVLKTVCHNDIGKCDLDRISWGAVKQLWNAESLSQRETDVKEVRVVAEKDSVESVTGKRSLEDESNSEMSKKQRTDKREEILSILEKLRAFHPYFEPRRNFGVGLINYFHYKLVEREDWDKLEYNLKLFGGISSDSPLPVSFLFDDAYEKLTNPAFTLPKNDLDKALSKLEGFLRRPTSRSYILSKLQSICVGRTVKYAPPVGTVAEMEEILLRMARDGDMDGLNYAFAMYYEAAYSPVRMRTLFQRAYDYLK